LGKGHCATADFGAYNKPMRAEEPAVHHDPVSPSILDGGRWATALGAALLVIFAAAVAFRWLEPLQPRNGGEEVIQQPVPDTTPSPRQEPTAPDPGDNP
jgi:hypothetical protein